jgi:hypothetical protein
VIVSPEIKIQTAQPRTQEENANFCSRKTRTTAISDFMYTWVNWPDDKAINDGDFSGRSGDGATLGEFSGQTRFCATKHRKAFFLCRKPGVPSPTV